MTQSKKVRFSDLLRLGKGEKMPEGTNSLAYEAANAMKDPEAFEAIRIIELGKWYGMLKCGDAKLSFRHGVCQSINKEIPLNGHVFEMNIINENVDFSKPKKD